MAEEHIRTPANRVAEAESAAEMPAAATRPQKTLVQKDPLREVVETVVFVIVLVLLLKTFDAEAFVIPTGSMATTLLGNHLDVTCPQCGHHFIVNASSENNGGGAPAKVTHGTCENCLYHLNENELYPSSAP
jgi:signal peptidase I